MPLLRRRRRCRAFTPSQPTFDAFSAVLMMLHDAVYWIKAFPYDDILTVTRYRRRRKRA